MKTIIFVCKTCEVLNAENMNRPLVQRERNRPTEYESMTDAWNHLVESSSRAYNGQHNIVAEERDANQ